MVVTKPETEDGTDSPLIADKLTEGKEGKWGFKSDTEHVSLNVATAKLFCCTSIHWIELHQQRLVL